ncbi:MULTISPECIES: hypothetical protein [Asanoa]|uniref:Uncharacterized protein n=2 Tax=Asanoa TaxID=195964 RepID=A0A239PFS8_9ACTN|nr:MULTISPECIES: hypothetical protein [Asanoa]GIF74169.1 hypothetical protein Asi02nite_36870 [Asanoa siamensis]SNT65685.1 hypothetical protein SAMN05421812_12528 [Asanoa hainanensis]
MANPNLAQDLPQAGLGADEHSAVAPKLDTAEPGIAQAAEEIRESCLGTPPPIGAEVATAVQKLVEAVKGDDRVCEDVAEEANALWAAMQEATAADAVSHNLIRLANLLDGIYENEDRGTPVFDAAITVATAYLR